MEFSAFFSSLQSTLGQHIPGIFGALVILLVGWLVAVLVRAGVRKGLSLLDVNSRISETAQERLDVEKGIAVGVFWLIMLVTLIGVLNTLNGRGGDRGGALVRPGRARGGRQADGALARQVAQVAQGAGV